MKNQIEDIIALQIGKLILKNIKDELEKQSLVEKIVELQNKKQEYSTPLDENGLEITNEQSHPH
jgi:hypothetical protein